MSDYALILSVFSSISPVQAWPSGNQSIISYISLPRLNAIVKKTMEIVWSGFLGGIVLSLMVYLSMWLTLNGNVQKKVVIVDQVFANFNCVTRAPLLHSIRSWVALSFKVVSESVSQSGIGNTCPDLHFVQYIKAKCPLLNQYHQLPTATAS